MVIRAWVALFMVLPSSFASSDKECVIDPLPKAVVTITDLTDKSKLSLQAAPQASVLLNKFFDCAVALQEKNSSGNEMYPWGKAWVFIGGRAKSGDGPIPFYIRKNGQFFALELPRAQMADFGTSIRGRNDKKPNYPDIAVSTPEGNKHLVLGGTFLMDGNPSSRPLSDQYQHFDSKVTIKLTPFNPTPGSSSEADAITVIRNYISDKDHPPGTVANNPACSNLSQSAGPST